MKNEQEAQNTRVEFKIRKYVQNEYLKTRNIHAVEWFSAKTS